jgi:hypothetical protein
MESTVVVVAGYRARSREAVLGGKEEEDRYRRFREERDSSRARRIGGGETGRARSRGDAGSRQTERSWREVREGKARVGSDRGRIGAHVEAGRCSP